jgi:hypothetical protein
MLSFARPTSLYRKIISVYCKSYQTYKYAMWVKYGVLVLHLAVNIITCRPLVIKYIYFLSDQTRTSGLGRKFDLSRSLFKICEVLFECL